MNFSSKKFITKGVDSEVDPLLQLFMWQCIDAMPPPKDYLQIFEISSQNGATKIKHVQEEPEYTKEYLLITDAPIFVGKIFVIDDNTHSTMLLSNEY
jgi:hypothetical protein